MNRDLIRMYAKTTPEENTKKKRRKDSSEKKEKKSLAMSGDAASGATFDVVVPDISLDDMGGIDEKIMHDIRQLLVYPLSHPEVFSHLGVEPSTGVLLHGPPGCGKTMMAHAIAGTAGCTFYKIAATEIVSGMSGESEQKLRDLFAEAKNNEPALIFLDEIDSITPKRENASKEMERRIVAQLLTCMDDLKGANVMILGATNRPDSLDPALRRAGRFDREISMGIPNEDQRLRILQAMSKGMRIGEIDWEQLAKLTPGFVGADLSAVNKEAAMNAVFRIFNQLDPNSQTFTAEELEPLSILMEDYLVAVSKVQPSSKREGFTMAPDVTWEKVGALEKLRKEMELAILAPIKHHKLFSDLSMDVPAGCLLFGPPGCGKTLLAKAVANASGASFISIKGPELLNKYVGESEKAVRQVFQRAAASSPCVVFFDELDSLAPKRSSDGTGSSERVVNQLLTELDGMSKRSQVFVVAATNRPDIIDPAMLRPGRLDRLLYVPLPDEAGRKDIISKTMCDIPNDGSIDAGVLASLTKRFSGADIASLIREATMKALVGAMEAGEEKPQITMDMFKLALQNIQPSVTKEQEADYLAMADKMHTKWL